MRNPLFIKIDLLRNQYKSKFRFILFVGLTTFFLSVSDSIMSYIIPGLMLDSGLSESQMGLLYSSSAFFGLILDFVLAKFLKITHYKVTFLLTGILGILFPLLMFVNPTYVFFLIGMFIWGLYYNLWGFARNDFLARESKITYHVAGASLMMAFHDIGYLTGTLSAQPLLDTFNYQQILKIVLPIILLSLLFQMPNFRKGNHKLEGNDTNQKLEIKKNSILQRLLRVSMRLFPLLLLGIVMSSMDAITWTVTPVIDRIMPELENLGGVILAANFLPSFIAYSFSNRLTKKFGKKKTTIISFVLGSFVLSFLGLANTAPIYILISIFSSFFIAISYSAYAGAIADYISESKTYDSEIMSTNDMSTNIGYILGPAIGGILLTTINSTMLFSYIGIVGIFLGLLILLITPKHIPFHDNSIN